MIESRSEASISSLIIDYGAYLAVKKGRARSAGHRQRVRLYLERMLWGADRLEDVTTQWVEDRMAELLHLPVPASVKRGKIVTVSRNTINCHRCILSTFFVWLKWKRRLVQENPVDATDALEREDARGVSRSFSSREIEAFWRAAPDERFLVYITWATTGLRPTESRRLRWPEVILDPADGGPPHFILRGDLTKNGKAERQPLHQRLVELLLDERRAHPGAELVFSTIPTTRTFNDDLRAAGLWETRETSEGKLTRYSLRKSFITDLVSDERNSQVAHKLARHSDPRLTYGTYTTFDLRRKAEAVQGLGLLPKAI